MTQTSMAQRLFADVSEGQQLAPLQVDMTTTLIVLGAMASRDWRPMHHDRDFAVNRNGVQDVFMNTPNQAAWFERYITDWSGPKGRIGRMKFRMKSSIFPGDVMALSGRVAAVQTDDSGCAWVQLELAIHAGARLATECSARVALPRAAADNPWLRNGASWRP
jgi:acyl dehydratase